MSKQPSWSGLICGKLRLGLLIADAPQTKHLALSGLEANRSTLPSNGGGRTLKREAPGAFSQNRSSALSAPGRFSERSTFNRSCNVRSNTSRHEDPQSSPSLFPPRRDIQGYIRQPNPSPRLSAALGPSFPRNNGFARPGPRSSAQRNGRRCLQPLKNMRYRPSLPGAQIQVPRARRHLHLRTGRDPRRYRRLLRELREPIHHDRRVRFG